MQSRGYTTESLVTACKAVRFNVTIKGQRIAGLFRSARFHAATPFASLTRLFRIAKARVRMGSHGFAWHGPSAEAAAAPLRRLFHLPPHPAPPPPQLPPPRPPPPTPRPEPPARRRTQSRTRQRSPRASRRRSAGPACPSTSRGTARDTAHAPRRTCAAAAATPSVFGQCICRPVRVSDPLPPCGVTNAIARAGTAGSAKHGDAARRPLAM